MPFCYICNVHLVVYRSECSDNIHSLCPQRNTCKAVSSPFSVKEGLSVTENKPYKIFTLKLLGHSISLSKTTRVCNIIVIISYCHGRLVYRSLGTGIERIQGTDARDKNKKKHTIKNTAFSIQCFHSPYHVDFIYFNFFAWKYLQMKPANRFDV